MRYRLLLLLAVLAVALALGPRPAAAKGEYYSDFEKYLNPWVVAPDENRTYTTFELRQGSNGCIDGYGRKYANLKSIVRSAGAGAWMVRSIAAAGTEAVDLTFNARDNGLCPTCTVMAFAGSSKPTEVRHFTPLKPINTGPGASDGWNTYRLETMIDAFDGAYVAIGWSVAGYGPTPARNERLLATLKSPVDQITGSFGFDCVNVLVYPAP
jgi:hypothetical protein